MAEISGSITILEPENGAEFAAGSSVNVKAQATVIVPKRAVVGVHETYRVTLAVDVYSAEACASLYSASSQSSYTEGFEEKTYTTSEAAATVTGDGGYLVTATLKSEKK